MTFHPGERDTFMALFAAASPRIRAVPGCLHLELLADAQYPNILTTLSHWTSEDALDAYRTSALFRDTWARTRPLFAAPPRAHSYRPIELPAPAGA